MSYQKFFGTFQTESLNKKSLFLGVFHCIKIANAFNHFITIDSWMPSVMRYLDFAEICTSFVCYFYWMFMISTTAVELAC